LTNINNICIDVINADVNTITDKQSRTINISADLTTEQYKKAFHLINKYKHLFTSDSLNIDCANVKLCEINLKTNKSIFQPLYRVLPVQRNKLKILIDQMIKADIIEPSKSNYAAPIFLISQKEKGEYRFVIDYRKLNDETINGKYPIPRSQDLFRSLEGAKLFFYHRYIQIPIKKKT